MPCNAYQFHGSVSLCVWPLTCISVAWYWAGLSRGWFLESSTWAVIQQTLWQGGPTPRQALLADFSAICLSLLVRNARVVEICVNWCFLLLYIFFVWWVIIIIIFLMYYRCTVLYLMHGIKRKCFVLLHLFMYVFIISCLL